MANSQVMSDLHLSRKDSFMPPDAGADFFVLAGDLSDDMATSIEFAAKVADKHGKPVVFVPGNHEYYGGSMAARLLEGHRLAIKYGVHLLHNRAIDLCGVRILGSTLWTDFLLFNEGFQTLAMHAVKSSIDDYTYIFKNKRNLRPEDTLRFHDKALRLLTARLDALTEEQYATGIKAPPVLVVTHQAPARPSIAPEYQADLVTAAFVSDLSDIMLQYRGIKTWAHGHTHTPFDYWVGDTRVVCNPRGRNVPGFNPDFVVEIN